MPFTFLYLLNFFPNFQIAGLSWAWTYVILEGLLHLESAGRLVRNWCSGSKRKWEVPPSHTGTLQDVGLAGWRIWVYKCTVNQLAKYLKSKTADPRSNLLCCTTPKRIKGSWMRHLQSWLCQDNEERGAHEGFSPPWCAHVIPIDSSGTCTSTPRGQWNP